MVHYLLVYSSKQALETVAVEMFYDYLVCVRYQFQLDNR